jgi:hypothetical protein
MLDKRATMNPVARFTPAQRALFHSLRRILIAALRTLDDLLIEDTRA